MSAVLKSRFYLFTALALAAWVLVGFSKTYYLPIFTDPPRLSMLMHGHVVVFTAWLALFVAQARLVSARRIDLHRKLGIAGAVLAIAVFVMGVLAVLETSISDRVSPTGLKPAQFSIIGFTSIGMFALFTGLGLAWRRRPALHRRLMIVGMVAALSPATGRMVRLLGMQEYRDLLIPLCAAAFIVAAMAHDWRKHHIVHPVYVIGGLVIVASWPLRLMVGRSEWYYPIGESVARLARALLG